MMANGNFTAPGHVGCCALIAVKQRAACKTRLRAALSPAAHLELVRSMLDHCYTATRAATLVQQVIVLTPERDTLAADVPVLADTGSGLNPALTAAHDALLRRGVRELLVLPADLPNLSPADIDGLVEAGRGGGFAIASDLAGVGTNALFVRSERVFGFQFGADSLRKHLAAAHDLGLAAQQLRLPGLAFDVDRPEDLVQLGFHREILCLQG